MWNQLSPSKDIDSSISESGQIGISIFISTQKPVRMRELVKIFPKEDYKLLVEEAKYLVTNSIEEIMDKKKKILSKGFDFS